MKVFISVVSFINIVDEMHTLQFRFCIVFSFWTSRRRLKMSVYKIGYIIYDIETNALCTKIFCNLSLEDRHNKKLMKIILEIKLLSIFKLITMV